MVKNNLLIVGKQPLFDHALVVGKPNVGDRLQLNQYFNEILDNKWLTNNGQFVQKFECCVEHYLGVKHCIAVCNATIGLEIAIKALNITGEIIMPSFTFIASAHAAMWQGVRPVFCDVDPVTHNIDVNKIERLISSDTGGIMGVHVWGRPCNIDKITTLSHKYKIPLLFDAAHAFGCSYKGKMIGNFGDIEVFSFHATKFLNTFEGGAVTTNSDYLAKRIRSMKNFGFVGGGGDNVIDIGTNGKMNEFSAAMGLVGMNDIDKFILINYNNYILYKTYLRGIPGIHLIEYDSTEECNYQYIVLEIENGRDELLKVLQENNIIARRYFYPGCHNAEPYKYMGCKLPDTERLIQKVIVLPTGISVTEQDIIKICKLIKDVMEN